MMVESQLDFFENLYEKTYDRVLKFIILNCSEPADVNDIIQDTYIELYKIIERKKVSSLTNASAYMIGIAKNKLKKYYGFRYKFKNLSLFSGNDLELIDLVKDDVNIENIIINDENMQAIWEFLKKKKAIISKIFYLHYYLDMTIKEVAKELKVKESTVKSHLYRTLKELSETFGREEV